MREQTMIKMSTNDTNLIQQTRDLMAKRLGHWKKEVDLYELASDIIKLARQHQDTLKQESRWNPVSQWKNDNSMGEEVLVCWKNNMIECMHYAAVESYVIRDNFITHFMPLPQPPSSS